LIVGVFVKKDGRNKKKEKEIPDDWDPVESLKYRVQGSKPEKK